MAITVGYEGYMQGQEQRNPADETVSTRVTGPHLHFELGVGALDGWLPAKPEKKTMT